MKGGHNFIDLTGKKVNFLTVMERSENSKSGATMWLCKCDCGNEKEFRSNLLTKGKAYSCGCKRRKPPIKDITGFENEYLKVLGLSEIRTTNARCHHWICICKSCGKEFIADTGRIKSEGVKGCGCTHYKKVSESRKTHGMTNTRLYSIWAGMKSRCYNKNEAAYKNYGGRGITVCEEWKNNFESFYEWSLKNGYSDSLTIDRIENDKGYSPENCRWATNIEQVRNRRCALLYTINGKEKTLKEWCDIYNQKYKVVYNRIFIYGYDLKQALTKKKGERNGQRQRKD